MGYLCTNFLNSTVMCFLRPIVQFELTYVLDCTCLASSVPSLTSHRRMHWHLWTCWDHLQSTLLLSNSGRNEYSWCLLLFCRGESTIILVFSFSCLWRYWIVVVAFSIVLFPFFFGQVINYVYRFNSGSLINCVHAYVMRMCDGCVSTKYKIHV